ncbi:site-specific integrase [Sporolactobacillus shoreae]|uniref:Site-specific integrase n=1 Tax=Sporolactobacillus shoreae TaxID=1465501 RepID=A0A4Z0GIU3_9BACL|nr:site-specific integrase [Sporolactobacillus shoreae]TGA96720.1 site-specific integrase [Sporolactobacillus shoreae]
MIQVKLTTRNRNGAWQYRVRYQDENGTWHEKSKGGFKREREARQEGQIATRKVEDGAYQNERITVSAYLDFWFDTYKKDKLAYNSQESIKRAIKVIKPEIGHLLLDKLNAITYQKFINKIAKKYAQSTVRTYHARYHDAFKTAVKIGYLTKNPAADVVISNREDNRDKKKILELSEIPKFITAAKTLGQKAYTALFLDLNTGLRCGELIALTWDDYEEPYLSINKTAVHRTHEGTFIDQPKTKSAYRRIKLDPTTNEVLKAWKSRQETDNDADGIKNIRNLIFPGEDGVYFSSHLTVRFWIRKACEFAGIDHISTHSLRHTHTVLEMDAGADIKYVSKRLGHAKESTTIGIYHHVSEHIADESAKRYDEFVGQLWGNGTQKDEKS